MKILDPRGGMPVQTEEAAAEAPEPVAKAPRAASGKLKLGIIENANSNAQFILEEIGKSVVEELDWDREIEWIHKPGAGAPVNAEALEDLLERCDVVFAGTAD